MKKITFISPCFNEGENITGLAERIHTICKKINVNYNLLIVDNGSTDNTINIVKTLKKKKLKVNCISLSRNFGYQNAIHAGLSEIRKTDFVCIIDGDLQDPPEVIIEMYEKILQGYDIVNARRRSRAGETFFKKTTATLFYRFINYLSETEIPLNVGDFKIISKKVVSSIHAMREKHRFLRGMIPWTGFKETSIAYDRQERFAGKTKYPLKKMIQFAFVAVLSFSSKPLTIAIRLGIFVTMLGFLGGIYVLYQKLFSGMPVPGITSILLTIIIFSGLQITLIGLAGEYIARIFEEVKGRPLYIIEEKVNI